MKDLVDSLIANEATVFTEDDRESLMGLNEATLKKLIPNESTETTEEPEEEDAEEESESKETPAANDESPNFEAALSKMREEIKAEVMAEMKGQLKANQLAPVIDRLVANQNVPFARETLERMSEKELSKLESLANRNFSGRAGLESNEDEDVVPEMPELFPSK